MVSDTFILSQNYGLTSRKPGFLTYVSNPWGQGSIHVVTWIDWE